MFLKLTVEYDGQFVSTANSNTKSKNLAAEIQKVCDQLFKDTPVKITTAVPTALGVHALGQVVGMELETDMSSNEVGMCLNEYLPDELNITELEELDTPFNASENIESIEYQYRITTQRGTDVQRYAYFYPDKLSLNKLNQALEFLQSHPQLNFAGWSNSSQTLQLLSFSIEQEQQFILINMYLKQPADELLLQLFQYMVQVASSQIPLSDFEAIVKGPTPQNKPKSLSWTGLFLNDVNYIAEA